MTPAQTALNIRKFAELLHLDSEIYFKNDEDFATSERKEVILSTVTKLKDSVTTLEEALGE